MPLEAFSLLIICTIGYGIRLRVRLVLLVPRSASLLSALAARYILGSFLIGSSFIYRLILLILTTP